MRIYKTKAIRQQTANTSVVPRDDLDSISHSAIKATFSISFRNRSEADRGRPSNDK